MAKGAPNFEMWWSIRAKNQLRPMANRRLGVVIGIYVTLTFHLWEGFYLMGLTCLISPCTFFSLLLPKPLGMLEGSYADQSKRRILVGSVQEVE